MGEVQLNSWQSVENLVSGLRACRWNQPSHDFPTKQVLRPPRADRYTRADLLGGPDGEFAVAGVDGASVACFRMDLEVRSSAGCTSGRNAPRRMSPCSV